MSYKGKCANCDSPIVYIFAKTPGGEPVCSRFCAVTVGVIPAPTMRPMVKNPQPPRGRGERPKWEKNKPRFYGDLEASDARRATSLAKDNYEY